MIGTLRFSALERLLGPILSPATKKLVFDDIEDDTFPPLSSISFLSSVRDTDSKIPDTTKVCPLSISV